MGSKNKEKRKRHHDADQNTQTQIPEPQTEVDEFEDNNNIIVEKKHKKTKKKKKETIDVKIQTIHQQSDKISPLIGYFPTSFDPVKDSSEYEVNVYQNVKRNNRFQVVVNPNGCNVNFVGTNYSGEAAAPQLCTYALGVLDKDTQTLKIVPITANKIFRLEPKLAGSEATQDKAKEKLKDEVNAEEKADNRRLLDSMFSTKKTITKNKKIDSLRQTQDPRSKTDLDKSLEDVKINTGALEAAGTTNARNIPFHDMSASTPEKAYPLEKIIEKGEWDYLNDLLNISQGAEVTPEAYPIFVCNRVHRLKDIKDEYERGTVACVLQYITHLIKYKDKNSMDRYKSVKNHKFPTIVEEKFRTMFGEPDSKRLSDEKMNYLISHVLVLTLFVDGYRSDTSDIAKDLRMNATVLRTHYDQLGCKFVRENCTTFATLPVPLKFPGIRIRRKRARN